MCKGSSGSNNESGELVQDYNGTVSALVEIDW